MGKRDYDAMQETMRVLSNNYLMDKIKQGDQQFAKGTFKTHDLITDENNG